MYANRQTETIFKTYIEAAVKDRSLMMILESHVVGHNVVQTDRRIPGRCQQKLTGPAKLHRGDPIIGRILQFELIWCLSHSVI